MSVHPQAALFLTMTAGAPPLDSVPVADARQTALDAIPATGEQAELASVEDRELAGVRVRVYRPSLDRGLPVTVYLHGGGWVIGDLDTHDRLARDLARYSGAAVVAVDYRRAPEFPFPAALDDTVAVLRLLLTDGDVLGTDPARVAVSGDSAGGNLAAVAAMELRGIGSGLVHQVLVFPVADAAAVGETASYREYGEGHFLTTRDMRFFVRSYVGDADPSDPRLSPLRAADLRGLPPATVVLAECDPLRDEGRAYADRLAAAGVPVEVREYAGQVHPFIQLAGVIDDAVTARRWIGARLSGAFDAE